MTRAGPTSGQLRRNTAAGPLVATLRAPRTIFWFETFEKPGLRWSRREKLTSPRCCGAELAEHSQHSQQQGPGEDGDAVPKAPQEAVKVVLMPDGGFAVAVEVSESPAIGPGP